MGEESKKNIMYHKWLQLIWFPIATCLENKNSAQKSLSMAKNGTVKRRKYTAEADTIQHTPLIPFTEGSPLLSARRKLQPSRNSTVSMLMILIVW